MVWLRRRSLAGRSDSGCASGLSGGSPPSLPRGWNLAMPPGRPGFSTLCPGSLMQEEQEHGRAGVAVLGNCVAAKSSR